MPKYNSDRGQIKEESLAHARWRGSALRQPSTAAAFDHGDEETMAVLESSVGSYVVVVECSNVGGLTFQAIVQGIAYLAN